MFVSGIVFKIKVYKNLHLLGDNTFGKGSQALGQGSILLLSHAQPLKATTPVHLSAAVWSTQYQSERVPKSLGTLHPQYKLQLIKRC